MANSQVLKSGLRTRAVHAGRMPDLATGAIVPPLQLATTFERDADGAYSRGFWYSSFANPNRNALEASITELEGGACAVALPSGMAAVASVLSGLNAGDRVISSFDVFQGTARLLNDHVRRWGISVDVVDVCALDAVASAIGPKTRMIWVDTPSNPLLRVADIAGLATIARSRRLHLAVDTTFATFALQQTIGLGADVAVYAATKYLGGHSDVMSGLAVFREQSELYERARIFQINVGAVPAPFDCWLVHRGLRTLPLRMGAQSETALQIARMLAGHPLVERVFYPGLDDAPDHALAARQMHDGFGGVLSFTVAAGKDAALKVVAAAQLFTRAASLGGVESLIEHRASSPIQTIGAGLSAALPDNLIRLSVGLEDADDLLADLTRALSAAGAKVCSR